MRHCTVKCDDNLISGYWILDIGYWILDIGYFMEKTMAANFYSRVTFQNSFLENEEIFDKEIIDDSMFGNLSNSMELIGNINEDFDEISPLALLISKSPSGNGDRIEKLFLYAESGEEDSWDFITNILTEEFGLDSSDDDQEMLIDSIIEAFVTVTDYEPSSLGKKYISKEFLKIPKIQKKQAAKINYLMHRSMAHFASEVDFGENPCSASIEKVLLDEQDSFDWLDKYETIAIAFKK